MTVYPDEAAFPVFIGSGCYYDKLEAHLFDLLYTVQSVWNRQGIVNSVRLVVLLYFNLKGRSA